MNTIKTYIKHKLNKKILLALGGMSFSSFIVIFLIFIVLVFLPVVVVGATPSGGTIDSEGMVNEVYIDNLDTLRNELYEEYDVLFPLNVLYATDCIVRGNDYSELTKIYVEYDDLDGFYQNDKWDFTVQYDKITNFFSYSDNIRTFFLAENYDSAMMESWLMAYEIVDELVDNHSLELLFPMYYPFVITSGFMDDNYLEGRTHYGVDFVGIGENEEVIAAIGGKVVDIGDGCPDVTSIEDPNTTCNGGRANFIEIETEIDGENYLTRYYHLRSGTLKVAIGDIVEQGDELAIFGNSGLSTGRHLHFEIEGPDGVRFDPMEYFVHIKTKEENGSKN